MTKAKHELSWNSDVKIPNGKPKGGFKSQNGFTINTGVVNQIDNEPVSPEEVEKEIKVTDRDIGVLFPSLLFKSRVSDRDFLSSVKERILKAIEYSGLTAYFLDINNILEVMSNNNFGIRPMMGTKNPFTGEAEDIISEPFGPVGGLGADLYKLFQSDTTLDRRASLVRR